MPRPIRAFVLGVAVLGSLSACSVFHGREPYAPALPAPRAMWDNSPLIPVTPPPADLLPPAPVTVSTPPSWVPSSSEWALWRAQGEGAPARKGSRQPKGAVEAAQSGALIAPTRAYTSGGTSAMVHYPYRPGAIYEVHTAPQSPTYLLLPPGERLAAPPAVNPDAWAVGLVPMGEDLTRQETVVLRPLQANQETTTALLFQSGLMIFCKLRAFEKTAMVSVRWDVPHSTPLPTVPETPIAQRPPKIDLGRLHTSYRIEPQGKLTPPWVPVSTFDDGTRTYIKFREALTYTRAPGVFGVTPQGTPALVQSHMYVIPGQPERGAWLLVQGLWPALELKDSTGLVVKVIRQALQEVAAAHE